MILTLEEAKTKWCPMARAWNGDPDNGVAINRNEDAEGANKPAYNCYCIADECMAWRWEDRSVCMCRGFFDAHELGAGGCAHASRPVGPLRGYCGLGATP